MNCKHPNIYRCLATLKKECINTHCQIEQALDGRLEYKINIKLFYISILDKIKKFTLINKDMMQNKYNGKYIMFSLKLQK